MLGSMGRTLRFLVFGLSFCLATLSTPAAGLPRSAPDFPFHSIATMTNRFRPFSKKLTGRIRREPLNLVATIIFLGAIVHTFLVNRFRKIAHNYQQSYEAIEYLLHATLQIQP